MYLPITAQTGGTLIECAKALKEAGAAKVSCFVTHGVFPNESWRRFLSLARLLLTLPYLATSASTYYRRFLSQDGAPPLFEKVRSRVVSHLVT
tara:strand:- start:646 stop:924 length:279 start_codon:yes stop_codon:yes gene_type:complete